MSETTPPMVGASSSLDGVTRWLAKAAALKSPVVIEGEPGAGKQLAARVLHGLSARRDAKVIVLVSAGLSANDLLEVLEQEAKEENPGTVILRRVENLDARVQPILVRALKERYGEAEHAPRIVATAFRSLQQGVKDGSFREDLYFRLSVLPLVIPPLRDRKEDIPSLVRFALGNDSQGHPRVLSSTAMERVLAYPWPGNVRELLDLMATVRARTQALEIGLEHLPLSLAKGPASAALELPLQPPPTLIAHGLFMPSPPPPSPAPTGLSATIPEPPSIFPAGQAVFPVSEHLAFKEAKAQLLVEFEREYLARLLKRCGGSITRAAQESGLHRKSIERLVKKYQLKQRRRRRTSPPD